MAIVDKRSGKIVWRLGPTFRGEPALDKLAKLGMRFTNCCVTNSICTPSRAAILTGQYSHKNGVYTLNDPLDPVRQHLAHLQQPRRVPRPAPVAEPGRRPEPVTEPGRFASWIAPPRAGIDGKPGDFEYVKLQSG